MPGTLKNVKPLPAIVCLLAGSTLHAQTLPSFEVASVRQSPVNAGPVGSTRYCGGIQFLPGGRFTVTSCQLITVIQQVYGLRDYEVANAPKWISEGDASRYDIQAKATNPEDGGQLRLMAQALLADRFQLKVHREMRDLPVYALVAGKNGAKLQAARDDGGPRGSGYVQSIDAGQIHGTNVSMPRFIEALADRLDLPLVDKTGVTEPFDFSLKWAPGQNPADTTRPSIFTAVQEQPGLKLESQKLPVEVLVVDRVERPTEN